MLPNASPSEKRPEQAAPSEERLLPEEAATSEEAGAPAAKMAKEGRLAGCVVEGPNNATMALTTIYFDPTPSAEEENDAQIIANLAWARGLGHGAWTICGDWNRHTTALRADLLGPVGAAIGSPDHAAH